MAATRGRRPLVGVLTGGSGGTYIAPTLRSARGRVFPGVIVSFGGSSRNNAIVQRTPAFTQALEGGPVAITATVAQSVPRFVQALAGTAAATSARSVRVAYLVLEVPDPAITGVVTQSVPAFTQAVEGSSNPDDRFISIVQTAPAFTQAVEGDVVSVLTGVVVQRTPVFIQAASGTVVAPNYDTDISTGLVWVIPRENRTWKVY